MCQEEGIVAVNDNETVNVDDGESVAEAEEAADVGLPEQFQSVLGKTVKVIGKQNACGQALITYGSKSKLQGNVLLNSEIDDVGFLLKQADTMIEEGFLEDESGNEIGLFILPIDGVESSDQVSSKGIIIDCDLRNYSRGFSRLPDWDNGVSINMTNVLNAIRDFVKTISHLQTKGYRFRRFDGHQVFFHANYGAFQFVFDGIDILSGGDFGMSDELQGLTERAVSAIIMRLLTGSWPFNCSDDLVDFLGICEDDRISWDPDAQEVCGTDEALRVWNALPLSIRDVLFNSCLSNAVQNVTLEQWMNILEESISETETCVFCGNGIFRSANHCLNCRNTVKKGALMTKWEIENKNQNYHIRISFGRGTVLAGEVFGIPSKSMPFAKLMYNAKLNSIGLKNMSNIVWHIEVDGVLTDLFPGSIATVGKNMLIGFEGYTDIEMRFLEYEV